MLLANLLSWHSNKKLREFTLSRNTQLSFIFPNLLLPVGKEIHNRCTIISSLSSL